MRYLNLEDIKFSVVPVIERFYDENDNPVPNYKNDVDGLSRLEGVLESIKSENYKDFFDKATALLININLGHFFDNGNKRMALVTFLAFVFANNYSTIEKDKYFCSAEITNIFPKYINFSDKSTDLSIEFTLYHLSIIIADYRKYVGSYDELKKKVKRFIKLYLKKV